MLDGAGYPELPILEERVSSRFLRDAHALPVREDADELVLAMADPTDRYAIDAFAMVTGRRVRPMVAVPGELDAALERLYGSGKSAMGQIVGDDVEMRGDEIAFDADVQQLKDLASEAPVIRLVSLLITNALDARASDIHIEPVREPAGRALPDRRRAARDRRRRRSRLRPPSSSRIKIMAEPEHRRAAAAAGRAHHGCASAARRSTSACRRCRRVHGESVVMRILDKDGVALDLDEAGLARATTLERVPGADHAAARHHPRHRADGLAARRPRSTPRSTSSTSRTMQDHHRRGSGRVPARRASTRSRCKPQIGLTFAHGAALDPAPGPGHDHDRRDPRPRDGRDRHPGGAHRPPGASARCTRTTRPGDGHAPGRHGRRALPGHVDRASASWRSAWCARCARTARSRTRRSPRWSSTRASGVSPAAGRSRCGTRRAAASARIPATRAACRSSR